MTWDYELARRIRAGQERREAPAGWRERWCAPIP